MCRIAGILNRAIPNTFLETTVKAMCTIMQHGGPDDEGIFLQEDEHLVLGNRRLSLMDLSQGGHQPMHYQSRYSITYNGELYNFKTLKTELQQLGQTFTNNTDTEVILAAFAQWNTLSFEKLNGMFAFALWDAKTKEVFLVRDAAGIKPLYYSTGNNGLAFSSEIRGFGAVPYLQQKNNNAAVYLLAYGHIPEPVTTLENVQPLPKGCFLKYNCHSATYNIQSFAHFSFSSNKKTEAETTALVRATIKDAVVRQMIADAPVGVFLSGGVDSSIIAKLAENKEKKLLNTISVFFAEKQFSEEQYQQSVAKTVNSNHHALLITEQDFHGVFNSIKDAMDMPTCDGINTWFISKYAASLGLKAVLSGLGGDELFGGYPSFKRMQAALWLQQLPHKVLKTAATSSAKKLHRASFLRLDGLKGIYLFLRGYFTPVEIAQHLGATEKEVMYILNNLPCAQQVKGLTAGNMAGYMECNMYMQNQLLRDADVMSMANSLEIRVPFLDNEVIQLLFSTDEKIKFSGPLPKQLLINAFKDLLPEQVWNRKKMGFTFPFAAWMKNSEEIKMLAQNGNAHTKKTVQDFLAGKAHWSLVMTLFVGNKLH